MHPDVPVLMLGMMGSRQGWIEEPNVPAPCSFSELARRMVTVPGSAGATRIILGVEAAGVDGTHEVMRGEEARIGGIVTRHGITDGLFRVPGTHSKWVCVAAGRIQSFVTLKPGKPIADIARDAVALINACAIAGFDRSRKS